jgi:hypothetical protein
MFFDLNGFGGEVNHFLDILTDRQRKAIKNWWIQDFALMHLPFDRLSGLQKITALTATNLRYLCDGDVEQIKAMVAELAAVGVKIGYIWSDEDEVNVEMWSCILK